MPRTRNKTAAAPKTRSATSRPSSSSSDVEAVVLVDIYRWHDEHGDTSSEVHEASRDDVISVSDDEFKRGRAMTPQALAKAGSKQKAANEPVDLPKDLSELSDDELLELATQMNAEVNADSTRDELMGVVAAAPGGNERPNQ